jgi:outer membrane receptor protein involved in Fe transport
VWNQGYAASVRGGTQGLQYFTSGTLDDDTGLLPNDHLTKWTARGNFTFTPVNSLQMQWNSAYSNLSLNGTPSANNAQGLELNAFRQKANYFGDPNPVVIASVLDWILAQSNERFTTGGTATFSPLQSLTNRLTIGYDFSLQDSRNLRPFGFVGFPQGGLTTGRWTDRVLTFDYVGTYAFGLTSNVRSSFSWGGQAIGNSTHNLTGWGENFPGAEEPTVTTASLVKSWEEASKVWNAGFFFQNIFDISNRYFLTVGLRVDGNSAFGSGFGLQMYPKLSGSWVVSDEGWWNKGWGSLKLRTAYGQSGKAPGTFDKVRTWSSAGYQGTPAFVPQNVGNADLGPEVTRELELGFDGSWLSDRLTAAVTHYNQTTTSALFNVNNIPSEGFVGSQSRNVGKLSNTGTEIQLTGTVIQRASFGWTVGAGLNFTSSKVLDLGGTAPFQTARTLGSAWVIEGQPVLVRRDFKILNPDEVAAPTYDNAYVYGPALPTRIYSGNTQLRLPGNVELSAQGEYRGGNYMSAEPLAIGRSIISPMCYPYYVDRTKSTALKPETNALWRARCTPSQDHGYMFKADYFKLRSVSATAPIGTLFPQVVRNATLTATLANSYLWRRELPWMDPESSNNDGAGGLVPAINERTPAPITLTFSLSVTF